MAYDRTSPYFTTPIISKEYLDIMRNRPIPVVTTDRYWEITPTYHLRPDLLAYDLYENSKLWWVFAQRNPNKLKDPLFDFVAGTQIYIPQITTLQQALGV